jgi:hypothetical protein
MTVGGAGLRLVEALSASERGCGQDRKMVLRLEGDESGHKRRHPAFSRHNLFTIPTTTDVTASSAQQTSSHI